MLLVLFGLVLLAEQLPEVPAELVLLRDQAAAMTLMLVLELIGQAVEQRGLFQVSSITIKSIGS